jgi:hypothetical protein
MWMPAFALIVGWRSSLTSSARERNVVQQALYKPVKSRGHVFALLYASRFPSFVLEWRFSVCKALVRLLGAATIAQKSEKWSRVLVGKWQVHSGGFLELEQEQIAAFALS